MPEYDFAIRFAHRVLDRPFADPDDDLAMLARQFLCSIEWSPIESAPRTSHAILVWCPERKNTYIVTFSDGAWIHFGGGRHSKLDETPTHWRAIPIHPSEAA